MAKSKKPDRVDIFKLEICELFVKYLEKSKLDQLQLAKQTKINKAIINRIITLKTDGFTIDRLLKLLEKIRPDLIPTLKKSRPKK